MYITSELVVVEILRQETKWGSGSTFTTSPACTQTGAQRSSFTTSRCPDDL